MTKRERANRRLASRLGIELPSAANVQEDTDGVWSSGGNDTLYEGPHRQAGETRLDFVQGSWKVTLLGLEGRKNTPVGSYGTLDEAMAMARFLQTKSGRRAFRGVRRNAVKPPNIILSDMLRQVNGGAVRVYTVSSSS